MLSALEGRWIMEDGEGNTTFAVISASGEVSFVEDPDTTMRIQTGRRGWLTRATAEVVLIHECKSCLGFFFF